MAEEHVICPHADHQQHQGCHQVHDAGVGRRRLRVSRRQRSRPLPSKAAAPKSIPKTQEMRVCVCPSRPNWSYTVWGG